eukprot:CAMPEP_0197196052 /NCGR_PEP_ID=MMETSP1423-20130617/32148_1 /TAXON_ID=476441 /ORGANISM="Pseudo-nitzschia heimii, Strain UNC1101" /LENGTH=3046 /DNA_ID=CAMNT_0042649821 /DNA_START=153 /DNA_END=9293 /DNA_ORIENTATION=-
MTLNPLKERNPNDDDSQEGITVAIRMRPLNNVEENNRRIWKVLPKYSSIAQTSREGKPLPERISGRTFFTFDKTFGENINNKQVYDGVAKGIVNSVVDGLNGTIFAYGQTSSGKTYTMQGAGNLEQGIGGEGGVVHMSAIDIFTQIQRKQDRNFLVRVSFLEIYNEEVRDLLGDTNQTLQIREDPRRGVFVHSHEEIVTNFDDLLKVLVYGDKSRTFASTGMNERSSRSHTILRITIESREKECGDDKEDEDNGDDIDIENRNPSSDGAVRVSTLNLVDLAGSESVRHTGATGDRQKEGGLINQSLLTLSRVIVALGVPNQMHINFRDSKLTRILQPSLSGNARMAVICCATPSELYLEETRSTLQFASRAKLVKTNAKVNEVLDERSLIRRLQKELAEARRNQNGLGQGQVRDLQAQVATAGTQALEAKEKLDRLKASILNSGYIIDHDPTVTSDSVSKNMYDLSKKRRKSDGALLIGVASPSKSNFPKIMSPKTAPRRKKSKVLQHKTLDIKQELKLVQQALAARNVFVRDLSQTINKCSEEIKNKNCDVEQMSAQNVSLNNENKKSQADITNLQGMVATLKQSLDSSIKESEYALAIKDTTIMESFEKLQETLREKENSQRDKDDFVTRLSEMEQEKILLSNQISSLENDSKKEREDYEVRNRDFGSRIAEVAKEKEELQVALKIANTQLSDTSRKVQEHVVMMEEKESLVSFLEGRQKKEKEEFDAKFQNFESVILEASKEKEVAEAALKDANNRLDETTKELQAQVATTEEKISVIMSKEGEIKNRDQQQNILDRACKEALKIITTLREEKASLESSIASLQEAASTSDGEKESNRVKLSTTGKANEILSKKLKEANDELDALRESNAQAVQKNEISIQMLQTQIAESERELDEEKSSKAKLEETLLRTQQEYKSSLISLERRLSENEDNLKSQATINLSLETKLSETQKMVINTQSSEDMLKHDLEKAVDKNAQLERDLCQSVEALEQRNQRLRNLVEEQEILVSKKNSMEAAIVCHQQNAIEMERKLVNASEQISSFQSQCQSISIEKENLSVSLERMKQELNKTLSEMSALKTGHMEVSTKLRSFEIESTSKDSNMRKLEEKANVSKEEIQKLESLIDTANSKFTEKEAQFVKLSDEKKALEIHLEEIEDINATKISSLEQLHATKDQQTKELEHQLEQIKTSVQELQICNRDLIEEKKLLETRLEETEESKSSKIMNLEQLHTSKDEETKELKGQLGETKTKIQELNDIINDLIVQKKSLEANLQEMEDINLEKLTNLEQLHATKNQETKELADQLELTKTKMQELVHTNGILIDEKKSLESNLEEMHDNDTAKISNFNQLCATKDQVAKELEGEVQQMKTKVLEMQDSLENTKSKLLERDEELNKLTEEKKSFEIQLTEARDINATTIGTLEQCLDDKNQSLKEVLEQLEQSKAHINDQQAVIETTDSKLVGQEAVMKKLIQEKEALDKHLQEVQDIHSVKVATLEQLHVDKEQASNDLKNQLEQSKAEIQELQKTLESTTSQLEQQQVESTKLVEEKKALSDHLEELEDINNAKVSTLEQLHNDKEQAVEELKNQLEQSKAEIQELQNSLDSINSKLEQQQAESIKLVEEKKALSDHLEELEDINNAKVSTLEQLHNDKEQESQELERQLDKLKADNQELQNSLDSINSKLEQQQVESTKLVEEKKALSDHLQELDDINNAKVSTLEQLHVDKEQESQELERQLDKSKADNQELQNKLDIINSKLEQQQAESIKLVEEKKALSDHLQELDDINNAKVSTLEQLHVDKEQESQELERQLDKLKADNQELQNKLDSINSKLEQQGAELRKLTDDKATLEATIEEIEDINSVKESTLKELHAAIQEMEDISAAKDFNLEKICAEKDEAAEQFNQQVNDREEKFKILELKLKEMESSDSEKKVVIEQVEAEKEKLQTALDERKLHIGELQNRIIDLKSQIEGLSSNSEIQGNEIESLLLNLMQVTSEKQEFESSHVDLKKSCDSLSAENEIIHAKLLEADENNTEVELQLQALNIEYRLLAEKNHALEVSEQSLRKTQAENENTLAQENADLSEQIKTVFTEAKAIEEERKKLQYAYTNLESQTNSKILQLRTEIDTIESSRQEIIQSLSECEAEREDTKNELEALTSGRETLTRSLHDREAERDEAMLELKKLYDENRNLNESMSECIPKVKHEELRREISEMKNQNLELKHLLASVNDSEERLRNAVKIAEKNVVTKTTELEDAQFHISQIEKELSEFQTSGVEISKIEKSNSILVEECKNIRKEKEEIDQLLREEKEARTELQKRMGEEQRALVQDGEKRMDELRRQFEESEIKLKQSEAEGYAARQQIEELDDERNRLEEKYLEASAQLNSSDSSKHRQEAMIAELESELNRTKSDNYASKETIIDMKEKLRRSTRDSEKAMREREVAHSELSTLNRKLSSLENTNDTQEMENSKLKKKTKQFEANIVALQKELAEKENKIIMVEGKISSLKLGIAKNSESNCNSTPNGNDDSILIMKAKIEEMNDLITQKNDRIKKLEAVRLTKAKIQQIGQMKTDNTNLKKKCSNMQKEILRLQEEKSSVGTDDNMKSEIDELRFDKEAVERKLRKYATHCQRLEDDKAGVADALGSCGVTIEAHGNDVGEAIINLCDKLTTTEQALKSRKGDVSSFETENRTLQREIQELSDSQKKLKEELNLYEKEKYELETELENTKNNKRVAEELRAKLRFLEDENLQLMQDAKSSKRREQTARKEIEVLRMNIDQTSTSSDFDDFDVRQSSGDKNSFLTLSSKEDSDTTELTNLAEVCSMQNTGSELRRSTRMTRVEISKEDPELTELTKSVEASASTRRSSRRIRTEASKESSDRMDLTNLAETRASTRRSTRNTEAEASKENLDTMELTNLAEARASTRRSTRKTRAETSKEKMDTVETTNFFEEHGTKSSLRRSTRNARIAEESYTHDVSTSLRQSARKTKKRGVLSDNTNGSMNEGRRTRSTDKRQKVNALFETKHAINPTGNTPGLGESSSVETENTGECQQS